MIYTSNPNDPEIIGTSTDRDFWVFYKKPAGLGITGTSPAAGYTLSNLIGDVYAENCVWNTGSVSIALSWTDGSVPAILFLGNPTFNTLNNGDNISITRPLVPGMSSVDPTDQNIWFLAFTDGPASPYSVTLSGSNPSALNSIGLYHIGDNKWLRPSSISYPLKLASTGGLTDVGTVYGTKFPPRRQIKARWDIIDDVQRRQMEQYIASVHNTDAHYIIPSSKNLAMSTDYGNGTFIPPLFVRISNDTFNNDKWLGGWFWTQPEITWDILR
ncbi:MAG: hypothetical protein LBJ41_01875 [Treponema sp.]|jgi:hypothetical protein|nr:hypothetical protein [Treponema sp.]